MPAWRPARSTRASPRTRSPTSGRSSCRSTPTTSSPRPELRGAGLPLLPDVLPPPGAPFHLLFVGINPSLRSAPAGHHFARPGNRFWPAIHLAGFTPRRLRPDEDGELAALGFGVTNIAPRPTRAASELSDDELHEGARTLEALAAERAPRLVAVLGVTAWRTVLGHRGAGFGLQPDPLGGRPVWVLPNPSGLNAHHQVPDLARLYGEAREYALGLER